MSPALDAPLPTELTGRHSGWFTAYRRYPVFSTPWLRGRLRSFGLVIGLLAAALALSTWFSDPPSDRPWPGIAELVLSMALPAIAGPLLGRWVRRRGWPPRREGWALLAAIVAVVAGTALFNGVVGEPLKQFIAERTGNVGPDGKRKRLVMVVGVSVTSPDDPVKPPHGPRDDAAASTLNAVMRALIGFWLAGGLALRGWQRERAGLAALAHERALAEAQAQRREAELRLSVLAAQVEPHFLFNTLAGVRSAIASDPVRASEMIDRLVEYLRAAIPRLRSDGTAQHATVGGQFEVVRAYLGLMAARMPRLQYSVSSDDDDLLAARCPPLMLISLAENAVKHGVEMKIGPARIDVRAERGADGRLALTVEDDGAGFGTSASGSGLGLANIRERLAQLHGERAALTLKARPQGGVAATITVPLEQPT